MTEYSQGDIVRIDGLRDKYLIISNNSFIRYTGFFHVCPILEKHHPGPLHISITGRNGTKGVAICEQIKLIDSKSRSCTFSDSIPYDAIMNISDAVQGIFEYD